MDLNCWGLNEDFNISLLETLPCVKSNIKLFCIFRARCANFCFFLKLLSKCPWPNSIKYKTLELITIYSKYIDAPNDPLIIHFNGLNDRQIF